MRARIPLIAGLLVGLLLAGAAAVYAYDRSRADLIVEGVRVGGIDVGKLSPVQARAKLRRQVLEPLDRPVVVRARGERYKLTPEQARIAVDLEGSVRTALERSREGNVLGRTLRALSGGTVQADVALDIGYSRAAVRRLVRRVGKAVDRKAVDASVDLASGSITPKESRPGRRLGTRRLARAVRRRVLSARERTAVSATTRLVEA